MKVFRLVSHDGKSKLFLSPLFMVFIVSMFCMQSIAQNCNSELSVYQNRDARSASENDSTRFQLELTNNTSASQTYTIKAVNYNGSCTVGNNKSLRSNSNINLNVSFIQQGSRSSSNSITVPARSTVNFLASVTVPSGTPKKEWSCIEVQANSNACTQGAVSTILKVFVSDPLEN